MSRPGIEPGPTAWQARMLPPSTQRWTSLYLCHNSFSNPTVASPMSQFILQPFFCFSYITSSSLNSPWELPMENEQFMHKFCWKWKVPIKRHFARKIRLCHGLLYKGGGCCCDQNSTKMFLISSRLWFWWWLWYGTECYATENSCELRVRTKYHEHIRKYPKMQFKHHLLRLIICLITVQYLFFIIYYFVICIYLHFMSVE